MRQGAVRPERTIVVEAAASLVDCCRLSWWSTAIGERWTGALCAWVTSTEPDRDLLLGWTPMPTGEVAFSGTVRDPTTRKLKEDWAGSVNHATLDVGDIKLGLVADAPIDIGHLAGNCQIFVDWHWWSEEEERQRGIVATGTLRSIVARLPVYEPDPSKGGSLVQVAGHEPPVPLDSFQAWDDLPDDRHDIFFELELG